MPPTPDASQQKGHVLEDVAALLYSVPGVRVEKRVRLRPDGDNRPPREIDVLITTKVIGYQIQFAVECKNEQEPVGPEKIDAFRGKLELLDIPVQQGIYISPTGFTPGALDAAKDAGIRALLLKGLTANRLQAELLDAVQSFVFYLGFVKELAWEVPGLDEEDPNRATLFGPGGERAGHPADYLWKAWQWDQTVPLVVGEFEVPMVLPEGCHAVKDDVAYPVTSVRGKLGVKAFIVQRAGTATHFELRNAADETIDRQKVQMEFAAAAGLFELHPFEFQEELNAYLEEQGRYHVAVEVRVPRIQYDAAFWPLSARVQDFFEQQLRLYEEGEISELGPYTQQQLEGDNLAAAFEPVRLGDELVYPHAEIVRRYERGDQSRREL